MKREPKGIPAGGEFATDAKAESDVQLDKPLSQMTPQEVDAELEGFYVEMAKLTGEQMRTHDHLHYADEQTRAYGTPARRARMAHDGWPKSIEETEESLREKIADEQVPSWKVRDAERLLDKIEGQRARRAELFAEMEVREAEFRARPWPRFFLVTSSQGHIHSSMDCSTCKPSTQFGWMPKLSGQSEKEAVEANGSILCTVCYPSAPTEWTDGRGRLGKDGKSLDEGTCPGSGERAPEDTIKEWGRTKYGICPSCSEQIQVNAYRVIRKHKVKEKS